MDTRSQEELKKIIDAFQTNIDDPGTLSSLLVSLSALRFYFGNAQAEAETRYAEEILEALTPNEVGKKITVAEAERIADLATQSDREKLKNRLDSVDGMINVIKVRIKVLMGDKDLTGGQV